MHENSQLHLVTHHVRHSFAYFTFLILNTLIIAEPLTINVINEKFCANFAGEPFETFDNFEHSTLDDTPAICRALGELVTSGQPCHVTVSFDSSSDQNSSTQAMSMAGQVCFMGPPLDGASSELGQFSNCSPLETPSTSGRSDSDLTPLGHRNYTLDFANIRSTPV